MIYLMIGVGVIVFAVAVVLVIAAVRPAAFRIERSAVVRAPSAAVFPLINDLHEWAQWSPFEKLDPNMKKTYEGPAAGVGAISSWDGNSRAGAGRTTILESEPNRLVGIKLEMFRPFGCVNDVRFTLAPAEGAGTRVSWLMTGKNSLIGRVFGLFFNMDKMVGKEFEEGLAKLDAVAQAETGRRTAPVEAGARS